MNLFLARLLRVVAENVLTDRQTHTHKLVEMFNIVGERERPNFGFARDVWAA